MDEQKRIETRQRLENGKSYKWLQKIADIMDRYYLDAALGFAIPGGIGDAIAAVFSIGYVLFSAIGVRSFHRSNRQNMALIRGFVEGDQEIIHTVNKKAGVSVVIFVLLCALLFLMIRIVIWAAQYMFSLF